MLVGSMITSAPLDFAFSKAPTNENSIERVYQICLYGANTKKDHQYQLAVFAILLAKLCYR